MKLTGARWLWAPFFLFLSACGSDVPDVLAPDMVLHNGKIVTVDEDFSIAQAVAIKDGRFVAVGSDDEHCQPFSREVKDETIQYIISGICNGDAANDRSFSR